MSFPRSCLPDDFLHKRIIASQILMFNKGTTKNENELGTPTPPLPTSLPSKN